MNIIHLELFEYVKKFMSDNDSKATKIIPIAFRKRYEHIKRVYIWAKRLLDMEIFTQPINREAVLTAALFHDVGYAVDIKLHAAVSAKIFEEYAEKSEYKQDFTDFTSYLISNHSMKEMLKNEATPLELVILMEADLLDESGAMSIVWDCMKNGMEEQPSFEKSYHHIKKYSYKIVEENPMITPKAKEIWEDKQNLIREFVKQLAFDLDIEKEEIGYVN